MTPRAPDLFEFGVNLALGARGGTFRNLVHNCEHPQPFAFAQAADVLMIFVDGFADDFALGLGQTLGGVVQPRDGGRIEGEGDLGSCHTKTILPYWTPHRERKELSGGFYAMLGILMIFFWMAYCTSCALL